MKRYYVKRTYCKDNCGELGAERESLHEYVSRDVAVHAAMDFLVEVPPSGQNFDRGITYKSVDLVIEDVTPEEINIWKLEE